MIGHRQPAPDENAIVPKPFPPLHRVPSPQPITRTLLPKLIHHQAMTKFQDVLRHVHTEEELQRLNTDIEAMM